MTHTFGTEKKLLKAWVFFLAVVIFSSAAFALPVPFGVSGHVFGEDGETQVSAFVSVKNLNNSFYAEMPTGMGSNHGVYSVALKGEYGDVIVIKVWDERYSNFVILLLKGVMRDVNLRLHPNVTIDMVMSDLRGLTVSNVMPVKNPGPVMSGDEVGGEVSGKRFVTLQQLFSNESVLGFGGEKVGSRDVPTGMAFIKNDVYNSLLYSRKEDLLIKNLYILIGIIGGVSSLLILKTFITEKRNDGKKGV